MAVKPENQFISGVHKHLPDDIYSMKTNNPYVAGIPDCYYSGDKSELWVEYKFIEIPKRATTMTEDGVTSLQYDWLSGRHAEGRNVAIIVGSKPGGVILRMGESVSMLTSEFLSRVISRANIALWIARQTSKR